MGRKILWAVAAVIIGLVILRISCPAISSHLPFGPSKRTLLAQGVDAFDLSYDGKQIAILSNGKLKSISSKGDGIRDLGNRPIIIPGYEWAEVRWSGDDSNIAVGTYYEKGNSPLMIYDLAYGTSQEIARALSLGSFVWFGGSKQLAWIQHDALSAERYPRIKSSIYLWKGTGRPNLVYNDQQAVSSNISRLKWIPGTDTIGFIWNNHIHIIRTDGSNIASLDLPSGKFPIPLRGIRCWDISQDGKLAVFQYAWSVWLTSLAERDKPIEIGKYRPIEIKWSPDNNRLAFITTSPESGRKRTPAPGQRVIWPPHQLHFINKDGGGHRLVCTEKEGIKSIEWLNNNEVLYLSGKDLYRRAL